MVKNCLPSWLMRDVIKVWNGINEEVFVCTGKGADGEYLYG